MRKKRKHFEENAGSAIVLEPSKAEYAMLQGQWHHMFGNRNPIVLELGCGKGAYTIALARLHPDWNVIGIDRKGDRIWYGMKEAKQLGITNVRFLRAPIALIDQYFAKGEVHEIWITFPDPHPKRGSERQRMTSAWFLNQYARILRRGGVIHLKTDSQDLHTFTKAVVARQGDFVLQQAHADIRMFPEDSVLQTIQTAYEIRFRSEGLPITYLRAKKRFRLIQLLPSRRS